MSVKLLNKVTNSNLSPGMKDEWFVFKISQFLKEQNIEIPPFNEQSLIPMLILQMKMKLYLALKNPFAHISVQGICFRADYFCRKGRRRQRSSCGVLEQTCCSDSITFTKSNLSRCCLARHVKKCCQLLLFPWHTLKGHILIHYPNYSQSHYWAMTSKSLRHMKPYRWTCNEIPRL